MTVILIYCPECEIETNHKVLSNGHLICWCGCEIEDPRPTWTAEEILEREA